MADADKMARVARAADVSELAMRLACSPAISAILAGADVNMIPAEVALFNFAEKVIAERDRRRVAAEMMSP